jgi:phenylacetic acid degradation protein PaaD
MSAQDGAQATAEAAVAAMFAADRASQSYGMVYSGIAPGRATVTMKVTETMVNGQGACHGGVIFTLADTAFAFACNSHGPRAVAHVCEVVFTRPVWPGDALPSTATERARYGRNGVYDVTVTRDGETVAEFRGHARVVGGPLPDLCPPAAGIPPEVPAAGGHELADDEPEGA